MIWPLVILWLFLNFLDVFISWMAVQLGAGEVGFLYGQNSFLTGSINKMALALVIAGLVIWARKAKWLLWFNIGMFLLVLWNIFVLRQQI